MQAPGVLVPHGARALTLSSSLPLLTIRSRPRVGHGQDARARVVQLAVELVLKLAAPHGLATPAGARRVAALDAEAGHDAVKLL